MDGAQRLNRSLWQAAPAKLLEVIVTTLHEAREAEAGGAGRLELVRSLELGGLTPDLDQVRKVVAAVSIPVRVMLRENPSMSLASNAELTALQARARALSELPIDGLVLGFVRDGGLDIATTSAILSAAPNLPATFHRAFEHVADPLRTIETLKTIPQIDRLLTSGGEGSWTARKKRLLEWQNAAAPEITLLVGAGISNSVLADLMRDARIRELHVGRAARVPREVSGAVQRQQVAFLKTLQ